MSLYLIQVHDDGDTEVCKVEKPFEFTAFQCVSSTDELVAILKEFGIGEQESLEYQLRCAGDESATFPWTRFY